MKKDSDQIKREYEDARLEMEKYILVAIFLVQQRWGYIISKELSSDQITTKQWLLMIVLANAFQSPPSLQEMADAMSTTHQNVKQLATRLESRGFLSIERDPNNKRILRLKVTPECSQYWGERTPEDIKSITSLFQGLEDDDVKKLFEVMAKLEKTSGELYWEAKKI
ncbi:MAG TPA: MarR family transcriptional regulator [Methanobacteriaceae archaeon]|jgi:DNA-binding MarR family transcriptional regulator|nr:MarR family transcriptional regulator [Euryarchaeota archaeon]HNR26589.1 MarR family transcriptional regulator [Methanobacteriaceae archaeon]HNS24557.1 MarR family transcriptional regulator [Methanobacteriaceae archaeon]